MTTEMEEIIDRNMMQIMPYIENFTEELSEQEQKALLEIINNSLKICYLEGEKAGILAGQKIGLETLENITNDIKGSIQ